MGGGRERRIKISEIKFSSRHIIWKGTLYGHIYYWRKTKSWKVSCGVPQSLGYWSHAHNCSNALWYSIPYHVLKWVYECSNITIIYFHQTWHVISHASPSWNYYLLNKEDFQIKWDPTSMFFQFRYFSY